MYFPIILGTSREGRESEKVARFVLREVKKAGVDSDLIDTRDYASSSTKKDAFPEYKEMMKRADGLIVVSPEYNHGYPGELKILLDSIYEEYFGKPIGFCGVSAGSFGGIRAVEQLRLVAVELRMIPVRDAVYFGGVTSLFDEEGEIKDEAYAERIKTLIDNLKEYA